jgi:hypothetical protein
MGWFKKLFEKDDWRFVGHVNALYVNTDLRGDKTNYKLTYYLYENQHGERKFDVIDSHPDRGDLRVDVLKKTDWVFRNTHYREVIHPWLTGFRNKKFPTYDKAPMYDMKRFLEEE